MELSVKNLIEMRISMENKTIQLGERIISVYEEDYATVKKVISDPQTGRLVPTFSSSADYSGNYPVDTAFVSEVRGNVLSVRNTVGGIRGNIREDIGCDYLLFPALEGDYTISADITLKSVDGGTDKQGIAVGQFDAVKGCRMHCDVAHGQKNCVFQHTYNNAHELGACGNPKTAAIEKDKFTGSTFKIRYTKKKNSSFLQVEDAFGEKLISEDDNSFNLSQVYESIQEGKCVHYGMAFSGVEADIANLKLIDSEGFIVYDQNDYYSPTDGAPVVNEITKTQISSDRRSINIEWTADKKIGGCKYIVLVSKNGGEYEFAGTSRTEAYHYKPADDGTYTFKVYARTGRLESSDAACVSGSVRYIKPLESVKLKVKGDAGYVKLEFNRTKDADCYDIYRRITSAREYECITTINKDKIMQSDESVTYTDFPEAEIPVYYYVVTRNATNSSNPCEAMQALRTSGHSGEFLAGSEADTFVITNKSNDTLFDKNFFITGHFNTNGVCPLIINGAESGKCQCLNGEEIRLEGELSPGRNDIEVIFTNTAGLKSRKAFNFVRNPHYDILVDAGYTGDNGVEFSEVPVYSSINAALAAVCADKQNDTVIFVKNGIYNERVVVSKPDISILGEDSQKTVICYSAAVAEGSATCMLDRNVVFVDYTSENFMLENIHIENTYAYTNGNDQQADALAIVADNVTVINTELFGFQDTLLMDAVPDGKAVTRQYFKKCYITGNVDFIYGSGTAVFEDCDIVARYTPHKEEGCFTAARTYKDVPFGLIFNKCRFYEEAGIAPGAYRLARPWGASANTVFLDCYMSSVVADAGYGDMSGNSFKNARFAEYNTYGAGFKVNNDRPLLSKEQAEIYRNVNAGIRDKAVKL